jgi:hypothetical protein
LWIKALSLELSEIIEIEWMERGWSLMEDGKGGKKNEWRWRKIPIRFARYLSMNVHTLWSGWVFAA